MASIVLELQDKCTDSSNDIVDLLRKGKLVAVKLGLDDFSSWIDCELNGYPGIENIPAYRHIRAEMKVINPYRGLQPFFMPDWLEDELCNIPFNGPISSAAGCLASGDTNSPPRIPLSAKQKNFLLDNMEFQLEPVRIVNSGYFHKMIDAVRSKLLDWALVLEQQGILGDGLSFTPEEKAKAAESITFNIENMQGVVGDVTGSSLEQTLTMSIAKNDIESLKSELKKSGLTDSDLVELESAILQDGEEAEGGRFGFAVSTWMGSMVAKAGTGTWNIGIAAAGSLLGTALKTYYGF